MQRQERGSLSETKEAHKARREQMMEANQIYEKVFLLTVLIVNTHLQYIQHENSIIRGVIQK